jgi:hypothetical protein
MQVSLLKVFARKEEIFWRRNKNFFLQMKNSDKFSAFLVILIVSIAHYCFASMHFFFEVFLWLFSKEQFQRNLNILALSTEINRSS